MPVCFNLLARGIGDAVVSDKRINRRRRQHLHHGGVAGFARVYDHDAALGRADHGFLDRRIQQLRIGQPGLDGKTDSGDDRFAGEKVIEEAFRHRTYEGLRSCSQQAARAQDRALRQNAKQRLDRAHAVGGRGQIRLVFEVGHDSAYGGAGIEKQHIIVVFHEVGGHIASDGVLLGSADHGSLNLMALVPLGKRRRRRWRRRASA